MKKKIIIIGGGFGGLAVGCRLAALGHDIEIFEQRDKPGGCAYAYELNGFRFDGGPSSITAPFLLNDIFAAAGRNREDYFKLLPVNPFYRIFDSTGRSFDYNNDLEFTLGEIEKWNPADKEGYERLIEATGQIFEKAFIELADKPFLSVRGMMAALPTLLRIQSFQNAHAFVSRYIKNEFLRSVFSFHPLLIGGSPFESSSIYALAQALEREWGLWYAEGGTGAIVDGLARLFAELGGKIHTGAAVAEILVEGRRVNGVRLAAGSVHRADIVVANSDAAATYTGLIPARYRRVNTDARYQRLRYSHSLFVIYFGTRCRYTGPAAAGGAKRELAHHNLILGPHHREQMAATFDRQELSSDLTLFLNLPGLTDPSAAPEGCEAFTAIAPVPNLGGKIDWEKGARPYRDRILQLLEDNYLPGLRANIVTEHVIDPLHFQNTLGSYRGAAYSVRPVLSQTAWFRPHNRSEDFENLYLVGAGTHPGAGLPGVLSSAVIVENLIQEAG